MPPAFEPAVGVPNGAAPPPQIVEPIVYVNGKRRVLPDGYAETTLLEYLREIGLVGTKLGCGEGGCGACTVMVSHFDPLEKKIVHRSVNACLAPLYSVEGMHVVTVEGIGNRRDGLHPVQERLAHAHGSQCGFCTPGFVMSMYTLLRSSTDPPTQEEIEENLAGNLCRCTGYRPIVDAFRAFAKKEAQAHTHDSLAANGAHPPANGTAEGGMICPSTGQPCGCGAKAGSENGVKVGGCGNGACAEGGCANGGCAKNGGEKLLTQGEPIFPPELKTRKAPALAFGGSRGSVWHRPASIKELLALKQRFPAAKLVVGNTEVGIEMRFKKLAYPVLIGTTHVAEMNAVTVTGAGIEFGASVTLTRLMETCKKMVQERPGYETSGCAAIAEQLRWFAGNQIRNVSSIGGNVVTGSPISDLNPLWMATGAVFKTASLEGKPREVPARKFFLGYRKVDLAADELLASVFLPWSRKHEYVKEFKQAHRRDDDIALVNAGMRVAFERKDDQWVVMEASLAYGGVAAVTLAAPKTEAALIGQPWTAATLQLALKTIPQDIVISDSAPGGMPEFRRSLTTSFFFKLYVLLSEKLELEADGFKNELPDSVRSAARPYERPASRGAQYFDVGAEGEAVGQPLVHASAETQVTGEAQYADDIPLPANGLHGGLVLSTKPHAKLTRVDASEALQMPGVVGFFSAKDVPGGNAIGAAAHDEEVFATEKVTCVGQVIGIVVADTEMHAKLAAFKVKVEYEELPAIIDLHQAIEVKSFIKGTERTLKQGDVDACFASGECYKVCEGEVRMGGQEHFYLEPNSCLCLPGEAAEEMTVISSTQAPTHTQQDVAKALGIAQHKVISKARRIGGGFGGKETRTAFISCAAAIAAYWLKRAVRVTLDRDQDMAITGQRHAFVGKYKVGFTKEGKILALDVDLYNNGGNSLDLSLPVLERAIYHSENAYQIPNMRIHGWVCFSNKPTNTAFRGFGGPQGMLVVESWIEHVAREVGKSTTEVQELNMEKEGDVTYFGQTLENSTMRRIWAELKASSKHDETRAAVDAFNAANRYRKRGLAIVPTRFGISFTAKFMNQAGALVHVYTDGTVLVTHGGIEMGQGLHTKMAQVAATAFGIPVSSVFIQETSTDKVPNTSPTAASASSDLYGGAVHNACEQILARMAPMKEKLPPETSFAKLAAACYFERIDLSAHGFYRTPDLHFDFATGKGRPFNYFTYGAAASEVEIDTLTGDMTVRKTDIVMDLGRSLNPAIDIGQIEGAYVQGLGWCVIEELKWGDAAHPWVRPGHLFTQGPGTYKLPTVNDIPIDFQVALLKGATNPRAIHSSKAVGEPPLFLAASAFFAIKDAITSARHDAGHDEHFVLDSPATPERIRMACVDEFTAPFAPADLRPKLSV